MLHLLTLQNFRSHKKSSFKFNDGLNLIVGPNAIGKTNILEAIYLLSTGRSFKSSNYESLINLDSEFGKIKGEFSDDLVLEINFLNNLTRFNKKYFVNGVPRFLKNFIGNFETVIFKPDDVEIVVGTPSKRRDFLDNTLLLANSNYYSLKILYDKCLKQRNAMLENVQKVGIRNDRLFEYWDEQLINTGNQITTLRAEFIDFINLKPKNIFDVKLIYDKSEISTERLLKYKDAEVGAGTTLVGPQRDDLIIQGLTNNSYQELKHFGSRGQIRLSVLQLISLQFEYIKEKTGKIPTLLLDDIFSELDIKNTKMIIDKISAKQTIITSTQKEIEQLEKTDFSTIIEIE